MKITLEDLKKWLRWQHCGGSTNEGIYVRDALGNQTSIERDHVVTPQQGWVDRPKSGDDET